MSLWNRVLYRKPVEKLIHDAENDTRLHRVLGPVGLTSLGVGAIIGAGIFVTTGKAASIDAGPAICVSYLVAALACVLAALCYAEFASSVPVAGSAYTYAFATLGEVFAWIIGWDLLLEYAMSCATVASAWTGYLEEFLKALFISDPNAPGAWKYIIPPEFQRDPYTPVTYLGAGGETLTHPAYFNLPAVAILGVLTWVLVRGIKESVVTNTILVVLKLGVVLFVIVMGAFYVNTDNWTKIDYKVGEAAVAKELSALPPAERAAAEDKILDKKWGLLHTLGWNKPLLEANKSSRSNFAPFGWAGIMVGASIVFFAFIGFDSISTHAEEAKNPGRDVPFGIIVSLVVCTILYVLVSAVITGMVPYYQIDHHAPIARAFADRANGPNGGPLLRWATVLIAGGGLAGMTSVLLVTFLSQARIFMAMARDGLLPKLFGTVHKTYGTPHWGTLITGAAMCFVAAFTPIQALEEMVNIGTLFAFTVVCAAVLILRVRHPDVKRPFRCPLVYVVAPLGIVVNITLMLFLPRHSWERLAIWMALGLLLYFVGLKFRRDPSAEPAAPPAEPKAA